ncbi:hypothetical protein [Subtercola boreus]|uniref:Uncharacterized protein n=1 Tax=Subtercola boreus TaxID=120213 RepID=A0A3E0W7R6_9MICO|nr:hypothetical protein [Subtercola boreus]RFA18692.1 hypothetical protein B7R24_14115 [Subtercola boreus]RFA18714.1 hypothetical protein B7R23_14155 [Subtercola boreus]RFA25325.1 hypothetical protein B7R25_14220 [Subtercola boreus]
MVRSLFVELVELADDRFCPEISHAEALFGRAADPDVPYSLAALRRLGRSAPAVTLDPAEELAPTGMRTTFGDGSPVRVEVFYERSLGSRRRAPSASIRSGPAELPQQTDARRDPARSALTEHAVSYLVRNDQLVVPVPRRGGPTEEWEEQLLRTTHWVSDMRRRHDRLYLDDGTHPVLRIDDPLGRWAAMAFDLGRTRVTIAGVPALLDRRFIVTRPRSVATDLR